MARKSKSSRPSSRQVPTTPATASTPIPADQSATVDATWAEMEALILRLESLALRERQQIQARFHGLSKQEKERWWGAMLAGIPMTVLFDVLKELFAFVGLGFFSGGGEIEQAFVSAIEDRFIPKPRKTARDDEIVQLRDDKALSFGQIGKKLKMSRDAVEKAYHRRMKRQPPADKSIRPQ